MARVAFLLRVLRARLERQDKCCPYCHEQQTQFMGSKRLVLQLRKCPACKLMFRWPKDTVGFNRHFYQKAYNQPGLATELPDPLTLKRLVQIGFGGTDKDFRTKIAILKELVPRGRVLDFGCSWGYGRFQLRAAGYETVGFEISKPRAAFGRKHLGLQIVDSYANLDAPGTDCFDAIFCSHVLEHLPKLDSVFDRFHSLLKPAGVLLLFVPNCGGEVARKLGVRWGPTLCEKHPLAFDFSFFHTALPVHGFWVNTVSDPCSIEDIKERMRASVRGEQLAVADGRADGEELMVCAWKTAR